MTCARRLAVTQRPASSTSAPATSREAPRAPEPRPGARLPLLPALALLLGALSLFHAAPAEAQLRAAPTVTATATSGQVTVRWVHAQHSADWEIQWGTHPSGTLTTVTERNPGTRSTVITGLQDGTEYRFRVRGVSTGATEWSGFVTATTPAFNTMTLAASSTTVTEGQTVTFTVSLTSAATQISGFNPSINYDVRRITSEFGDHDNSHVTTNPLRTAFFFPAGQTSHTFEIATRHEVTEDQEDETFSVTLVDAPTGYAIGSPSSVTITIVDDDKPSVSLSASPNPVQEGSPVTVTASLSRATVPALTIPVTLTAGTAESGDYGTLTSISIAAGATSGTGTVTTVEDTDSDADTFTAALGTTLPSTVTRGSSDSVEVTISEKPTAPAVPTGLTVSEGNAKLDLSWTPPSGTLTGYDVHYTSAVAGTVGNDAAATGSNPAAAWVAVSRTEADPPTASQTISPLSNGTLYRVRVRAKNDVGDGAWVFGTGTPAVPTVTFQLSTQLVVESDTTPADIVVLLSSAQVQAVTVGISVVAASTDATAADYTLSATSVTFEAGSTQATFTVLATADMMDDGGNEQVTLRLTPPAGIGLGTVPENEIIIVDDSQPAPTLTAAPGNLSLALTWTAPGVTGESGWDVHYTSAPKTGSGAVTDTAAATGTNAAAAWVAVTRTGIARSQTISSLSNGTTYRLRVRSFVVGINNVHINGDWIFGTGTPKGPPAAPADLAVSGLEESLEVTWTASTSTGNAAPTYYEVAFDVATNAVTALGYTARTASGTATSLTIDDSSSALDILEATQYRVTIRACNPVCSAYAGNETAWTLAREPADIDNVDVTPGNAQLRLSWTLEFRGGQAAPTAYKVAYTASTTVGDEVDVGTDPATEWVDAGHSGTGTSHTITGLTNGQEYRVRVESQRVVNSSTRGGGRLGFGTGTPTALPTITLSVDPNPVEEGSSVTVTATLSTVPSGAVSIPVVLADDSAESGDYGSLTSIAVAANATTGTGTITTVVDADAADETFTVGLGTALPTGYQAASATPVVVTIHDAGTFALEISGRDGEELLIGPGAGLGDSSDTRPRWVQVRADLQRATLTPSWNTRSTSITGVSASVRYVAHGMDGGTLAWSGANENGEGKELALYSPLGSPGYPKLTIAFGSDTYTIYFQNNSEWKFHNDALKRLRMLKYERSAGQ